MGKGERMGERISNIQRRIEKERYRSPETENDHLLKLYPPCCWP
jgi:hypothetical protein